MDGKKSIRLGKKRVPPVLVPGEIFDVYQPNIGPKATLLWLNLRWLVHKEATGNIEEILQQRTGFDFRELTEGLSTLTECGLLEFAETGEYLLNEPLSAEAYALRLDQKSHAVAPASESAVAEPEEDVPFPEPTALHREVETENIVDTPLSTTQVEAELEQPQLNNSEDNLPAPNTEVQAVTEEGVEPTPPMASPLSRKNRRRMRALPVEAPSPIQSEAKPDIKRRSDENNRNADMDAVVQIYHQKIGMLGPTQYEKLRFWVEEQGMAGEVVALAIEETVQSAQNPRIQYLEGILRNWFNDGIFTLQDLLKHKKASKVLSGGEESASAPPVSMEGVPNASAYRHVDPEMVKKWKELYPDEYDS